MVVGMRRRNRRTSHGRIAARTLQRMGLGETMNGDADPFEDDRDGKAITRAEEGVDDQ
jgi:hypothetical protein